MQNVIAYHHKHLCKKNKRMGGETIIFNLERTQKLTSVGSNSSDVRVIAVSASGAVDSGLIPSRVKPMTLKLVFTSSLLDAQHESTVWRTSRHVYLLGRWERHLAGFPHFGVVDRWPAASKWVRYSALIAFS